MYTYYKNSNKMIGIIYYDNKIDITKLHNEFVLAIDNKLSIYSLYLDYSILKNLESYNLLIFNPIFLNSKFDKTFFETKELLAKDLDAYSLFTFLKFGGTTNKTKLTLYDENYIIEFMLSIKDKLQNQKEKYWACQVKTLLNQLLSHITTLNINKSYESEEFDIEEVKKYIDRNYYETINIKVLTNKFFVNRDKLQKLFKERFDTTVINYLSFVRINKAKKLLIGTQLPISEIIERIGFNSISNFNEKFKRKEGISPSKYRKTNHT